MYRELKDDFECKKYLYGVTDVGSKLFPDLLDWVSKLS